MRITPSIATPLRDRFRQTRFASKPYAASSPVIWQHRFLSDKQMKNWSEGEPVFLAWVPGSNVRKKKGRAIGVAHPLAIDVYSSSHK
jgi:hypothetical protein